MTEYGKKIGNALRAVRALHSDTSKLLQDCDGTIGRGRKSIFGINVTRDLTYGVKADQWMAEGVYRLYDFSDSELGLVEGVTIHFVDGDPKPIEPLLIAGRLKYHFDQSLPLKEVCEGWDLWNEFYADNAEPPLNEVFVPATSENRRLEWSKVIGVPLYDVRNIEYVTTLMERLRQQ